MSRRFQLLLILFVCLFVYYPVLYNTSYSIDDMDMIQRMKDVVFSWKDLFTPRGSFYYRPLLILSFWFDKLVWEFYPTFSLLENSFLHASNAFLIFFISEYYINDDNKYKYFGLFTALIFSVHPLATESVNWMSGRTDLLATFFTLAAVLVLYFALKRGSYPLLGGVFLLYVAAIFSKEVVIFFLPALIYLLFLWGPSMHRPGFRTPWLPSTLLAGPFAFVVGGYVILRSLKFGEHTHGVAYVLGRISYEGFDLFRVVFKVFGFYVKKLFFPFPLNFAIVQVSNYYVVLGMAVFVFALWLLAKTGKKGAFFVVALYMISPGIVIALTHVAWTPLAERYVYLSAAFIVLGVMAFIREFLVFEKCQYLFVLLFCLWFVPSAYACIQRSILWQDKEALYADTLQKSPDFSKLRNDYGLALLKNSRSDEALKQFQLGQEKNAYDKSLLNEAHFITEKGDPELAKKLLLERYIDKSRLPIEGLELMSLIESKLLSQEEDLFKRRDRIEDLLDTHQYIYKKIKKPFSLYRCGQLSLALGDKRKAQELFAIAYRDAPESAFFKDAAGKLAEKLRNELE